MTITKCRRCRWQSAPKERAPPRVCAASPLVRRDSHPRRPHAKYHPASSADRLRCKRPFGGPEQVIKYLGQYTHRVAICNQRLVAMGERGVTFRTKSGKQVTVDGVTFLSRWCQHVLPRGYVKIRHFGLMSSSHATTRLELARARLNAQTSNDNSLTEPAPTLVEKILSPNTKWRDIILTLNGIDLGACPYCGGRNLVREPLLRGAITTRAPPEQVAA